LLIDILPIVHHVLVMSVNPGFGGQKFIPFSLEKIRHLCAIRAELGLEYRVEVDGGIAKDTVAQVVEAGADLLVAGNAIFGDGHPEENARNLLRMAREAAASLSRQNTKHSDRTKNARENGRPLRRITGKRKGLLRGSTV
jgi:ribulose-phosphate 3-epimerase